MTERWLKKEDIAALFDTSSKAAEEQLAKAGLRPINLGPGRGRGKRWLESAVMEAMQRIHEKAQPRKTAPKPTYPKSENIGVDQMSTSQLEAYLKKPAFTPHPIIQ